MKHQIILLPDYPIIVSDEELKEDDICLVDGGMGRIGIDTFQTNVRYSVTPKKVVAGYPTPLSIDYNGFEKVIKLFPSLELIDVELEMENAFNETYGEIHGYYPRISDDNSLKIIGIG